MTNKAKPIRKAGSTMGLKATSRKAGSVMVASPAPGDWKTVQVGSVNVQVRVPTALEQKKRISESRSVVGRLSKAIDTHGVKLSVKATTPIYFADDTDTTLVVRKIGDKISRGMFNKNGAFVKVA